MDDPYSHAVEWCTIHSMHALTNVPSLKERVYKEVVTDESAKQRVFFFLLFSLRSNSAVEWAVWRTWWRQPAQIHKWPRPQWIRLCNLWHVHRISATEVFWHSGALQTDYYYDYYYYDGRIINGVNRYFWPLVHMQGRSLCFTHVLFKCHPCRSPNR